MAKGTISKRKGPSKHSREARRATSPSIDTDKSLKNVKPPTESADNRPSVLAIHTGAGVTKKTKRGRNLSSKAKQRAEKAQDKAAAIFDRTHDKVGKSKDRARTIQTRAKTWDEINTQIPKANIVEGMENEDDEEEVSDFDDEMGEAATANASVVEAANSRSNTASISLPPAMEEDEDDIL